MYFFIVILRLLVERVQDKEKGTNYMKDEDTSTTGLLAQEVNEEPEDEIGDQVHPLEFGN